MRTSHNTVFITLWLFLCLYQMWGFLMKSWRSCTLAAMPVNSSGWCMIRYDTNYAWTWCPRLVYKYLPSVVMMNLHTACRLFYMYAFIPCSHCYCFLGTAIIISNCFAEHTLSLSAHPLLSWNNDRSLWFCIFIVGFYRWKMPDPLWHEYANWLEPLQNNCT